MWSCMKLLIISAAFPPMPSGESTNTHFLATHLVSRGIDVHVLTGKANAYASSPGLTVHPIMPDWSWSALPTLVAFLRASAPESVLLMYIGWIYGHHPMITFAPTIVKKVLRRARVVTRFESVHGAYMPEHAGTFVRLMRNAFILSVAGVPVNHSFGTLLRDSDEIIVLSKEHREYVLASDGGIADKLHLIPPPPNMHVMPDGGAELRTQVRHALNISKEEILLVYLGYLYPGKCIDTLLRAFRLLLDSHPNLRLLVLGSGLKLPLASPLSYEDEMHQLAKDLGIGGRITWMGSYRSTDANASSVLRAADVAVLPFVTGLQMNNSSFACVAAHGLPVVSNRGTYTDDCLIHGENVFLCPPQDEAALARAIERVVVEPQLRQRLRAGVQKLAEEWFSWPAAIGRTIRTFGLSAEGRPTTAAASPVEMSVGK